MVIPFVRKANPARAGRRAVAPTRPRRGSDPIPLVGDSDPWSWVLAASLQVDLWKLARFSVLMAQQGMPVQLARVFREPAYAYEQLALAHGTDDETLRALSVEMFEQYRYLEQRRRSVGALTGKH
jgi:hypothetical protein